jgi:looped-hinge helix DNA binding domain, AbrB family
MMEVLMENIIVDNAKVMAKGQITLPKDIREALGVRTGDRVTLIRQNDQVIMMNAAVYAMKMLQTSMAGEAEKASIKSDEEVLALLSEMRSDEKE